MTRVGVVGSSARAAVHSLARAGFSAWAVDQFADRDLTSRAPCTVCPPDRYPDAVPELAAGFPPGPVLYTGGLENHPHVIRALAAGRALWGNPPEALARVRDPFTLFPALAGAGFAVPRLVPPGEPCPRDGRWLRKPFRSAGGLGIRFAQPGEAPSSLHFFQEFIAGVPMSALYADGRLFGLTTQLIGEPRLHAKPFTYCGNIGSGPLPTSVLARVEQLGNECAARARLRSVWGIDFILSAGVPVPLEVNPRYTAAVEVVEHATGRAAFSADTGGTEKPVPPHVGKAIYYAPHAITFPKSGPWDADLARAFDPWRVPAFADIPEQGTPIEPGSPVLTVFATGAAPADARERLQSRVAELDVLFQKCVP